MNFDLSTWYTDKQDFDVIFTYMGEIEESRVSEILERVETRLREQGASSKIIKKIYNVLVECLQNLYHHGEIPPEYTEGNGKYGVLIVHKEGCHYRVSTGNFIKVSGLKMIRDRIDQINNLTQDDKRSLYKLILNNSEYSEKGGGGLGMVDIARKAGNNMVYQFYEYSEDYIFLALDVIIS